MTCTVPKERDLGHVLAKTEPAINESVSSELLSLFPMLELIRSYPCRAAIIPRVSRKVVSTVDQCSDTIAANGEIGRIRKSTHW